MATGARQADILRQFHRGARTMLNPVFSRTSRQGGSSLIEVLVAIIVLSVGMLSMLWAQTKI